MFRLFENSSTLPGYGALVVEAHRRLWLFVRAHGAVLPVALLAGYAGVFLFGVVLSEVLAREPAPHRGLEDALMALLVVSAAVAFALAWMGWIGSGMLLFARDGETFSAVPFATLRAAEARSLTQSGLVAGMAALWGIEIVLAVVTGGAFLAVMPLTAGVGLAAGGVGLVYGAFRLGAGSVRQAFRVRYAVINRLAAASLPCLVIFLTIERVLRVTYAVAGPMPDFPTTVALLVLGACAIAAMLSAFIVIMAAAYRIGRALAPDDTPAVA